MCLSVYKITSPFSAKRGLLLGLTFYYGGVIFSSGICNAVISFSGPGPTLKQCSLSLSQPHFHGSTLENKVCLLTKHSGFLSSLIFLQFPECEKLPSDTSEGQRSEDSWRASFRLEIVSFPSIILFFTFRTSTGRCWVWHTTKQCTHP